LSAARRAELQRYSDDVGHGRGGLVGRR
jgi:hypothetical protein